LYQYDATGRKLKETIGTNVTDYNGNTIYKNGALYQISHDEGRIINGEYEYNIKDHLGNLRVAFRDSLGIAKITQANSYGVFGENLPTLSYLKASWKEDNFRYTGKENLAETGYTDFRARLYDNLVPRFISIDGKSEKWNTISPFCYVLNNPVSFIDIDGKDVGIRSFANGAEYPIIGRFSTAAGNNAFATYLRTPEGYSFVSKYAKANTVLFGVKFEKDGEFSNQLLEFNEVDNLGTALGYTNVVYRDAKNTGFTHLAKMTSEQISDNGQAALTINLATPNDVNSMISQMVVLGHESFIHNRNVDKTMRAFNKKDYKNAINIAQQNEAKAGPQGDLDHSEFINNPSHFSNFNSYVDHLRGLSQKYKFSLNILEEQIESNKAVHEKLRKK
jgi:RHS repeat-associated protein